VLARLATYLALTERQEHDEGFLAALGQDPLPSTVLHQVAARVRDAQWRWAWREARHAEDTGEPVPNDPPELGAPRVLDPFAGGGIFSLEAARLA
jgi:adenine-specific DNA methylase